MSTEPREIFPLRMSTTENVVDFRPVREDPDEPETDAELGKDGADSVQESVSSEDLTTSTEPLVLTTGVQIPVSKESTPKEKM